MYQPIIIQRNQRRGSYGSGPLFLSFLFSISFRRGGGQPLKLKKKGGGGAFRA